MDVGRCVAGPFELLLDPEGGGRYTRGYRLTPSGQTTVTQLARSVGKCSTCQSGGYYKEGFRVAINGTIEQLAAGDVPPILAVDSVEAVSAAYCHSMMLSSVIRLGGLIAWVFLF